MKIVIGKNNAKIEEHIHWFQIILGKKLSFVVGFCKPITLEEAFPNKKV